MGRHEPQVDQLPVPHEVPLEDRIRSSLMGVAEMRATIDDQRTFLKEQAREIANLKTEYGKEIAILKSEREVLQLMLDHERQERAYYHRFAVEVSAGLGLIGQVADDVLHKANDAAHHDDGKRGSDLPDVKIPEFLLRARNADTQVKQQESEAA